MASKVTRAKIREALREGWKAPEIMELYGISHHRVTKERKYLGMGKWRLAGHNNQLFEKTTTPPPFEIGRPQPPTTKGDVSATVTLGPAVPITKDYAERVYKKLISGDYSVTARRALHGVLFDDILPDPIGATIAVGPAPTADITPVDYVNAFEARVQEYHKTVAQLRQENDKLKEDNRKLRDELTQAVYQHRNWQPNSLVRTSLANGG